MTRRITIAILACVWAAMLVAGVTAYGATRAVLLRELDARLIARASALPEVGGSAAGVDAGDRYLIRGQTGQTVRQPAGPAAAGPAVLAAQFATLGDGRPYRSLTLRFARPIGEAVTVVYSGPADAFDRVLTRLAVGLIVLGVVGSVVAVGVAVVATKAALRPLRDVAGVIGAVDERHLNRRVPVDRLPPELTLVGQRLNDMLARLEHHADQRQQFLANASHELRTPVTALLTTLQVHLGRRHADADAMRQVLAQCLGDARLLRTLVERLMGQVRSESNAVPSTEDIDWVPLLKECLNVARGLALEKQITVDATLPPELFTRTEPERLRRVVLNLLSNAVGYNVDGGRITLTLAVIGPAIELTVADTGIGITADDLPNVFAPFFRADRSRAPADHLGLGLYQVKTDVAALAGTIDLRSTPGEGTTFILRLPLVPSPLEGERSSPYSAKLKADAAAASRRTPPPTPPSGGGESDCDP